MFGQDEAASSSSRGEAGTGKTALGRVIASRHPGFEPGDWVHGPFGVQEHAVSDGQNDYKIEVTERLSPATYLGVLGLTGLTAYFGLLDVGRLRDDETVLVSGAAGGVGTAVGQIAKIKGATVVGVAGGPEKCHMLIDELGFDAAVDYKRPDLHDRLRKKTPDRIDVFFDNVGGEILDGRTRPPESRRAGRHLRGDLPVQRERPCHRPQQLHGAARLPRHDGRIRRLRLRASIPASDHGDGRLGR